MCVCVYLCVYFISRAVILFSTPSHCTYYGLWTWHWLTLLYILWRFFCLIYIFFFLALKSVCSFCDDINKANSCTGETIVFNVLVLWFSTFNITPFFDHWFLPAVSLWRNKFASLSSISEIFSVLFYFSVLSLAYFIQNNFRLCEII